MIKAVMNGGPDYGQDVGPLIRAFFPDWDNTIEYGTHENGTDEEGIIEFRLSPDRFEVVFKCQGKEIRREDDFSFLLPDATKTADFRTGECTETIFTGHSIRAFRKQRERSCHGEHSRE